MTSCYNQLTHQHHEAGGLYGVQTLCCRRFSLNRVFIIYYTVWDLDHGLPPQPATVRLQGWISDGVMSNTAHPNTPQRTVPSPFLFIIYSADLSHHSGCCHLKKLCEGSSIGLHQWGRGGGVQRCGREQGLPMEQEAQNPYHWYRFLGEHEKKKRITLRLRLHVAGYFHKQPFHPLRFQKHLRLKPFHQHSSTPPLSG